MQYRKSRTCNTGGNGIEKISKKSTGISLILHIAGVSFLFVSPLQKQTSTKEIFTVHIIDIPKISAPSSTVPAPEKLPAEPVKKPERETEKKIQKEKTIKEPPARETPSFSAEKFKESLIAKAGISRPTDRKTIEKRDTLIPDSVKIEKIERELPEITISSLMSIPDWYLSTIHSRIKENWKTDNIIGERTAIVSFRVYRDGRIENIALEKSSGNTRFDRSVLEAVISTKKLPPFPVEITYNYLDVIIDFKMEG